ncbi:MAG: hypothetical protein AB1502_00810, partial [Thermodesulfobacteriota bacterium]
MKRIVYLLIILTGFLVSIQTAEAQTISTSPSSITIPRGLQSARSITFNVTTPLGLGCTLVTSTVGEFRSGNTLLGSVNTTLTIPITGTSGNATETILIPIRVIKMAEQLNVNRFQYRRTFNFTCNVPVGPQTATVQVSVTGEATAEFSITRLQLYFENHRAEITVKRNQPALKAYADIRFVGSGLLRGYWEVDGRILSHVITHLVYGRSITLESPEIPPLPTFITGTHIVRFIITNPIHTVTPPEAIYFVTAEEFRERLPIRLVYPKDKSEMDYSPITFKWEERERKSVYLVEFLEEGDEKPIFSAYAKALEYTLPEPVLKGIFTPGKKYSWRVKGFDADNNIVGESALFQFTFKELSSFVPGQILMAAELSQKGIDLIGRIGGKYNLGLIETFDIRSLRLKIAIFQTMEDIFRLIDVILKEEGVILAQPNYILRTMSE